QFGQALSYGESFDPATNASRIEAQKPSTAAQPLRIETSIPGDHDNDVSIDSMLVVRFTRAIAMPSASSQTVQLSESDTAIPIPVTVVPAEGGMLTFVTPEHALRPGTSYILSLRGVSDPQGLRLPDSFVTFTTAAKGDAK